MRMYRDSVYNLVVEHLQKTGPAKIRFECGNSETVDTNIVNSIIDKSSNSDVIIFAGGVSHQYEGEENRVDISGFYKGDRTDLNIPSTQKKILQLLKSTGKPVVFVLIGGSSFTLNWENENLDAIVEAWYPGMEAGTAIADVLFGNYNPAGRLPLTFYKSISDLPAFEDYNMQGRTYRYFDNEVLYPFGYGLSYTKFDYTNLKTPLDTIYTPIDDTVKLYFDIKNSGKYSGDEVVQVYVKNLDTKFAKEIKSLKGYKRINIIKGENISDSIFIPIDELKLYNPETKQYEIEQGNYLFEIGASSQDVRLSTNIYLQNEKLIVEDHSYDIDKIYPNPANKLIHFELNSIPADNYIISLIDIEGKRIPINENTISMNNSFDIDISSINNGTFILELKSGKNVFYKKFVIAK